MERQNKFVAFFNRKSYGAPGYRYEIQLSRIFDMPSIVNEKPSASN